MVRKHSNVNIETKLNLKTIVIDLENKKYMK